MENTKVEVFSTGYFDNPSDEDYREYVIKVGCADVVYGILKNSGKTDEELLEEVFNNRENLLNLPSVLDLPFNLYGIISQMESSCESDFGYKRGQCHFRDVDLDCIEEELRTLPEGFPDLSQYIEINREAKDGEFLIHCKNELLTLFNFINAE